MDNIEFKNKRLAVKLSQERLAAIIHLSPQTIRKYERGKLPIPWLVEYFMGKVELQQTFGGPVILVY
jgi:DNA-binding XRE family transcriptional regulator